MRSLTVAVLLSVAVCPSWAQEKTPFTIDTMWAVQRVGTPAVSPDGTMVFLVRTGSTRIIDVATGRTTDLPGDGLEVSGWQRLAP